ncbi:unnamed protein product, partial [Ixodes pacificus]
ERGARQEDERESRPGKTVREETPKEGHCKRGQRSRSSGGGAPATLGSSERPILGAVEESSHASLSEEAPPPQHHPKTNQVFPPSGRPFPPPVDRHIALFFLP